MLIWKYKNILIEVFGMLEIMTFLIALAFDVLIIAIFLNSKDKMDTRKKGLCLLSLLAMILTSTIPTTGYRVDSNLGFVYLGFPAEMLVYRGDWGLTFTSLGLIFNFFFYYWCFKLIFKILKVFTLFVKKLLMINK
jgi:hypothetical protein